MANTCTGKTIKGQPCKSRVKEGDTLCWRHNPDYVQKNTKTCSGETKDGKPCKLKVKEGHTLCWRHDEKMNPKDITWVSNDKNFDERMKFFLDKRLKDISDIDCFEPISNTINELLVNLDDCSLSRYNETDEITIIKDFKRIVGYYKKKFGDEEYSSEEFQKLKYLDEPSKEQATKRRSYKHIENNIEKISNKLVLFFEDCQIEDSESDDSEE